MSDLTQPTPADTDEPVERFRLLRDGRCVREEFYRWVRERVLESVPALEEAATYKTKHLVGADHWALLSRGEKVMAGLCLAHMVACGELPLRFAVCPHRVPKLYRRA
jgi:hypothetical protein